MSDINIISNLQVPPTTTMPAHVASANPHPQYALTNDIASIVKSNVCVSDLADVNVGANQADNTLLIFSGGTYSPVTLVELGSTIQVPYATSETAGVLRIASNMTDTSAAVIPSLLMDYVSGYVGSNQYTLTVATSNTLGGVTLNMISDIASDIVAASAYDYATTTTSGIVRLATTADVTASDQSAVVTAGILNDAISANAFDLPAATANTLGGVKIIDTDNSAGKSQIADLITNLHGTPVNNEWIGSYVPQIQYEQFVNVNITTGPDTFAYYKTHPIVISEDNAAETLFKGTYYNVGTLYYLVYSNGVLSGRNSYDSVGLVANMREHTEIHIHENGAAYDINTYGKVYIHQEGNIKRWVVNSDCFGYIHGLAHNVLISAETSGVWGANAWVCNHGHVEYATIEGTGQLICGASLFEVFKDEFVPNTTYYELVNDKYVETQDTVRSPGKTYYAKYNEDAVVENVTVCNATSDYAGLQIYEHGKGYNIVLVNKASAYIYGYAKDVIVHSGCCLFVKDTVKDSVVTATAKIDNLILYTGATIFVDDGAEINGCILHPGVIINPQYPKATIHYDTCRETEHPVWIITKRDVHYYHDEEKNSDYTVNYYTYKDTFGNITTSTTLLPQQVAFLEPANTPLVHHPVTGNNWDGHTVSNRVYVWAIDMPRGLYRSDLLAEENYKAIAAQGITSENAPAYTSYFQAAYRFYDLQVASYGRTGVGLTNYYALQPTSTVVDELITSSERFKANIIF